MPVLGEQLGAIQQALGTPGYKKVLARVFPDCPSISIDYGVMEKSQRIVVVPADFGWSDVGSFAALPEVRETDHLGNVAEGDALVIDGRNNVVLATKGRPVAVIGMDDVVVVDAGDAILVCRKDRAQDVRKAVDELARRGRDEVL
jgi:mannose-1-phosphate guanylyltransferase